MLRSIFLSLSKARWAHNLINNWKFARNASRRFVAGETEAEAVATIKALNADGLTATVDVLGESITSAEQAKATVTAYLSLLEAIHENDLKAWVSVKLTAIGLDIDEGLCHQNLREILDHAGPYGIRVTIDMEDHTYTERTLALLHQLHDQEGYHHVRGVIQSYLYRSDQDVQDIVAAGIGLRLCKGAYKEPAEVAYPRKSDVDRAYRRHSFALLAGAAAGQGYPGIATHDEKMINAAIQYCTENAIPSEVFEFQMLLGVRSGLQKELVDQGFNVRVYIPFGDQWYGYYMRRLAERPANLYFILSNLFKH